MTRMTNCRGRQVVIRVIMADRVGFEPTDGHDPSPVFETGTLNRSDICPNMAESVGFEPTVPCGITGFQDRLLKPLGQLSI